MKEVVIMSKKYFASGKRGLLLLGIGWIILAIIQIFLWRGDQDYIRLFIFLFLGILCFLRALFTSLIIEEEMIKTEFCFLFRKKIRFSNIKDSNITKRFSFRCLKLKTNRRTHYIYEYFDISLQDLNEIIHEKILKNK